MSITTAAEKAFFKRALISFCLSAPNMFYLSNSHLPLFLSLIYSRRQICSPRMLGRLGTWNDGLCPIGSVRTNLSTRQFRIWPIWRRQQLGQRSLHRGRRVGRLGLGRRQERVGVVRLPSRIPIDALLGRRHRQRHGHPPHLQNQGGIPRQNHEHLLRRTLTKGQFRRLEQEVATGMKGMNGVAKSINSQL